MQSDLDRICLELARRRRDERIRYFVPNGGQKAWIDEISRPGAFIVVNGSGNGQGKSYGLIAVLAAFCWPTLASAAFQAPIFQSWAYPKRARLVSTPKELEEIGSIQSSIAELFPKGRYEALKKGKSFPSQFKTDTGWIIDLMSYEQDKGEMAGPSIGLLMWNEPMPQDLWNEGMARLRKGGLVLVAMTSLADYPWVADGILGRANGRDVRVIYSDVETNCKQHGVNGTLEHEQIEKILAQYDPDEREARKTGKPLTFSGRIFKAFDRAIHVAKEPFTAPDGATIYQVVDPAIGKPIAALWAFVDQAGVVHVYDESPEAEFEGAKDSNMTVKEYADEFKRREIGRSVENRIMDRHFGNVRRTLGGLTLKQEFAELGVYFTDSYSMDAGVEVETGILKVKEYLHYDKTKPMDGLNRPRLIISPTCRNTITAMERWSRDPKTGKPNEEYKDFSDCLRYLVMSNPRIEAKRSWESGRQAFYGVGT